MGWLDIAQIIFIVLVVVIGISWMAKILFTDDDDKKE
jgi:hypothetical protein